METIDGPLNGFYIAAYAERIGNTEHFAGYAKVCSCRPDTYWEANCIFKLFGGEHHATPEAAVTCANLAARTQIARLPSLDLSTFGFAMLDEARQVWFPLAPAIRQRTA